MKKNPNTSKLWDKLLFDNNPSLRHSPYYIDKINKVTRFLRNENGKFLDIGFGAGNLEQKLKNDKAKLKLYGVDFSPAAITSARKRFQGIFLISKIQKLPFKKCYFNCAVMLDVLEHIPEKESKKVLDEVNRVLKRNSVFVISVPLNEDLKKMNKEGTNYNAHLRQYTPPLLEKELKRSGFEIIKKDFIIAFNSFYFLKNIIARVFPDFRKPNLLIFYCRKK